MIMVTKVAREITGDASINRNSSSSKLVKRKDIWFFFLGDLIEYIVDKEEGILVLDDGW